MEMEPNLNLNQTSFKFFVKIIKTRGFRIQKTNLKIKLKVPSKTKQNNKLEPTSKVCFEIMN
jgi:hypothetical protein